jgi:hypothetical protein
MGRCTSVVLRHPLGTLLLGLTEGTWHLVVALRVALETVEGASNLTVVFVILFLRLVPLGMVITLLLLAT